MLQSPPEHCSMLGNFCLLWRNLTVFISLRVSLAVTWVDFLCVCFQRTYILLKYYKSAALLTTSPCSAVVLYIRTMNPCSSGAQKRWVWTNKAFIPLSFWLLLIMGLVLSSNLESWKIKGQRNSAWAWNAVLHQAHQVFCIVTAVVGFSLDSYLWGTQ